MSGVEGAWSDAKIAWRKRSLVKKVSGVKKLFGVKGVGCEKVSGVKVSGVNDAWCKRCLV